MRTRQKYARSGSKSVKSWSDPRLDEDVRAFFDRFAKALTAGDGKTIASMWQVPALVLGDNDARGVTTLAEVEQFFGGAREQYNARGIVDTRADILDLKWLTPRIALVDVRWPYLRADGGAAGEETSSYVLKRDKSGRLMMQTVIMRGAA